MNCFLSVFKPPCPSLALTFPPGREDPPGEGQVTVPAGGEAAAEPEQAWESTISAVAQVLERAGHPAARDRMLAQAQELKAVRSLPAAPGVTTGSCSHPRPGPVSRHQVLRPSAVGPSRSAHQGHGAPQAGLCRERWPPSPAIGYDHDGEPRRLGGDLMSAGVLGPRRQPVVWRGGATSAERDLCGRSIRPQLGGGAPGVRSHPATSTSRTAPSRCWSRPAQLRGAAWLLRPGASSEGDSDGKLCRPVGRECGTRSGHIVAATAATTEDPGVWAVRHLHHKFGTPGSRPGQFDRPGRRGGARAPPAGSWWPTRTIIALGLHLRGPVPPQVRGEGHQERAVQLPLGRGGGIPRVRSWFPDTREPPRSAVWVWRGLP